MEIRNVYVEHMIVKGPYLWPNVFRGLDSWTGLMDWTRSLVPRPLFFFLCGGGEKKGLVDLQYIFCAAGSTTFGDR